MSASTTSSTTPAPPVSPVPSPPLEKSPTRSRSAETLLASPLQLSPLLSSPREATPTSSIGSLELCAEQSTQPLDDSTDTSSTPSEKGCSSDSADMVTATLDTFDKLDAYHIHCETPDPMPAELHEHIIKFIKAHRIPSSPAARLLGRDQPVAVGESELTGIFLLAPNLLFRAEIHGGERYISETFQTSFESDYLPGAPDKLVKDRWSKLSQSVPDSAIGYIPARNAASWKVPSPFTQDEEEVVNATIPRITNKVHFPFLTSEWKSGVGNEVHAHASLQAARGGACVVNYNHSFLERAGMTPSSMDTRHFSITCDMRTVMLYVHWRATRDGNVHHYSQMISHHKLRDDDGNEDNPDMLRFRGRLRNVLDWAVGERLAMFQRTIAKISEKNDEGPKEKRQKVG